MSKNEDDGKNTSLLLNTRNKVKCKKRTRIIFLMENDCHLLNSVEKSNWKNVYM